MPSEMVRRAAAAFWAARPGGESVNWDEVQLDEIEFVSMRAAIAALRAPTPKMIVACDEWDVTTIDGEDALPEELWHAMIDAALVE